MACCRVFQGPVFVPGLWLGDDPSYVSEPWTMDWFSFSSYHICRKIEFFFGLVTASYCNLRWEVIIRDREAEVGKQEKEKKHAAKTGEGFPVWHFLSITNCDFFEWLQFSSSLEIWDYIKSKLEVWLTCLAFSSFIQLKYSEFEQKLFRTEVTKYFLYCLDTTGRGH